MPLTRTEIEILIKARNEAQSAFDSLNKQIKTVTGESQKAATGMDNLGKGTKGAGVGATAAGVAFGLLAERIGRGLVNAFQDTISAANRLDAGLIGLSSVANAFGQDAGLAQMAAQKLAADGLMSVGEAATSLKNLLAAGFGLDQAITLVERFKDTAAFGRQAALGFGQAISSATEGIKNGNSILVDNAGVTKNLSNILVEAGFSATDLSKATTDANVRMALFNGLVKETTPQLGDAARLLKTAAGQQAIFNSQIEIAQAKIGKALQPALASMLSTLIPLVKVLGDNANILVPLAAAVAAVVIPLAALNVASALGITRFIALGAESVKLAGSLIGSIRNLEQARIVLNLLADSAGITATKLGLVGTAASIAGSAFIGWQIGKIINEVTGADVAFGNLLIRLQGIQDSGPGMSEAEARMRQYLKTLQTAGAIKPPLPPDTDPVVQQFLKIGDAANVSAKRIKAWEQELALVASAGGLKTLASEIDLGVQSTKELSAQFGISEDAIKFYEKKLKDTADKHKDAADAAKKHQDAVKQLADQMLKAGIINAEGLKLKLADLDKIINQAASFSVPGLKTALEELGPEYDALIVAARNSGINVEGLSLNLEGLRRIAGIVRKEEIAPFTGTLEGFKDVTETLPPAVQKVIDAYHEFGLKTPEELRIVARESAAHYRLLISQGTVSTKQLKDAYTQMITDQRVASGQLPSIWQKEIVPGIKDALTHMNTAVQGSFAQMLIGAKGFHDGFSDIWKSLKATAMNVMNEILSAFLNSFVKGMLGALTGQQGAFGKAFAGLLGGATGGGGGGLPGVPGSTSLLAKIPGLGFLGGGGATAAGVGGGAAAGGGGAGAGAATAAGGIGLGSTIAITGGIAGAALLAWGIIKKGLFRGGEESLKVNQPREAFFERYGGSVESLGEKLGQAGVAGEAARLLIEKVFQADTVKKYEAAVLAVETALAMTGKTADQVGVDQAELSVSVQASSLAQTTAMKAVVQQLIDMGALTDANGQKITDLGQVQFKAAAEAAEDATVDMQSDLDTLRRAIERLTARNGGIAGGFDAAFDAAAQDAQNAANRIQSALNGIDPPTITVPYEFEQQGPSPGSEVPTYEPPPPEPDAYGAHGVMAKRPGIVAFGEGGEDEVGGPAKFFEDIFKRLGIEGLGSTSFVFNVTTTSAEGLREAVEKDIIPMMIDAVRGNRRQARTNLRAVMGVS